MLLVEFAPLSISRLTATGAVESNPPPESVVVVVLPESPVVVVVVLTLLAPVSVVVCSS